MHRVQTIRSAAMARHRHTRAYAALVLSGSYEEARDSGFLRAAPGDAILHESFEEHLNRFPAARAVVLNIALDDAADFTPGLVTIVDPDGVARTSERDTIHAAQLLLAQFRHKTIACEDWPDALARELLRNPHLNLRIWSRARAIAPWALSRGFARMFGITPSRFRVRARARAAWAAIRRTDEPLAGIAARLGFSDQPHMTRSIGRLTGRPPLAWRNGVQDAAGAPVT